MRQSRAQVEYRKILIFCNFAISVTTAPPPKCVSPHIQQQVPQSDANAGFGVPNLVEQPVQNAMLMVGNIPVLMNATASTTTSSATEAVITAAGPPSYLATTPSVGSSATPFQLNPMLSFGTQLTHVNLYIFLVLGHFWNKKIL